MSERPARIFVDNDGKVWIESMPDDTIKIYDWQQVGENK
jgi:streptogramin lyase